MTDSVRIAIVGCGGMGHRHLAGLGELARSSSPSVELVAVCDPKLDNAEALADEAERLLGRRPSVHATARAMVSARPELEAADCTTDTGSHHAVVPELLELGLHTMCEKPLALTIRGCDAIREACRSSDRLVSVAENFRRDPMNRLVKALIEDGAIGAPQFVEEVSVGGRDDILITPWRHMKRFGTIPVDAGVHSADLLQYLFGPVSSAAGLAHLFERTRHKRQTAGPGGFYERWAAEMPEQIEPDGEDAIFGLVEFENGSIGQWTEHHAGHGLPSRSRLLFGTRGSIVAPGDRNGNPVRLVLDDGTDLFDERVLDLAPSYHLPPLAAELFGSERPWRYDYGFVATDRKLLALEYDELAQAVRTGAQPEVDVETAARALALVYALFESSLAHRSVALAEVLDGSVDAYQRDIDLHLGLLAADVSGGR
ncbi:MAG: Gfo/Idh/MocA family protein [Candidatus Dormibacteraceae bacterium]